MFKFSFHDSEESGDTHTVSTDSQTKPLAPVEVVSIDLLKEKSPRISYTKDKLGLPKRDLFDVKYELMATDNLNDEEKLLLSDEDVRKNVYEGGLKVWEGAYDLLEVLTSKEDWGTRVMELGCGAGLPILYIFHQTILSGRPGHFVLADYNPAVLRLLTMPNLVLTWLSATNSEKVVNEHEELVIDADTIDAMVQDLAARGIQVEFVSGAWSERFSEIVGTDYDLVLASETIYSLDSVPAFTDVLKTSLNKGTALVAAKKVYFGVGGDVVHFTGLLDRNSLSHDVVLEKGSVGRVVLEIHHL